MLHDIKFRFEDVTSGEILCDNTFNDICTSWGDTNTVSHWINYDSIHINIDYHKLIDSHLYRISLLVRDATNNWTNYSQTISRENLNTSLKESSDSDWNYIPQDPSKLSFGSGYV
jgi:hypothetical protein